MKILHFFVFTLLQPAETKRHGKKRKHKETEPIWCSCGVRIIHASPFGSPSHFAGAEFPCSEPSLLSPDRPEDEPYKEFNSTHCLSLSGSCFRTVRFVRKSHVPDFSRSTDESDYHVHKKAYGCVPDDFFAKMTKCHSKASVLTESACCEGNNCNAEESLGPTGAEQRAQMRLRQMYMISGGIVLGVVLMLMVLLIMLWKPISRKICTQVKYYNYCQWSLKGQNAAQPDPENQKQIVVGGKTWTPDQKHEIVRRDSNRSDSGIQSEPSPNTTVSVVPLDFSENSGSGAGPANLVQRTISRQITLLEIKGKGRYGEVYHGRWQGTDVAVKKFYSWDDISWARECSIYTTSMLRHSNILGFVAADNKDNGHTTELWLITDYHHNGSLFDYLHSHVLTMEQCMTMIFSAISGLEFLHKEIFGTRGKCAIAHRDIKSKNILVKSNGECVIGDLGLAIRYDSKTHQLDLPTFTSDPIVVGTKRYLAPEIITRTLNPENFSAYARADIYGLGLVFWEIISRTRLFENHDVAPYKLPFEDQVPGDPTLSDMKAVVVDRAYRPVFSSALETHTIGRDLMRLVEECWMESPEARLTPMRIRMTAQKLMKL
ncbi:Oidioi.mRNA.OKI2018_I69.chr1.g1534.t1.cds [Oikopleura dioica]|uniref:receptor protein serine/threonine kinase n=1 Tax=Oikopleura dioica TaxID=34765 RepID=A0ABN7SS26_OIKDI|nr:Oidioi.mRNA.OKI2018_I69.chr1.g1534.t1.cds [Oikopleura dioica]